MNNIDEIKLSDLVTKIGSTPTTKKTVSKVINADKLKADLDHLKARLKASRLASEQAEIALEKTLTPAEKKKREEIARAIERDNPGMDKSKKMAIATAQAKRVAESSQLDEISKDKLGHYAKLSAASRERHLDSQRKTTAVSHEVQARDPEKAARLRKMSQQHAKKAANRQAGMNMAINKLTRESRVVTGGYRDKDGKYHPPKTRDDLLRDAAAKRRTRHQSFDAIRSIANNSKNK